MPPGEGDKKWMKGKSNGLFRGGDPVLHLSGSRENPPILGWGVNVQRRDGSLGSNREKRGASRRCSEEVVEGG